MQIIPITLAGVNATGNIIDLQTLANGSPTNGVNKCGWLRGSVNGTSGDFWVQPFILADGEALPSAPTDPRPAAGFTAQWTQIKSGESFSFGTPNSKGYDPAVHGQSYFTHLRVWCQGAGTVTATQLRVEAA